MTGLPGLVLAAATLLVSSVGLASAERTGKQQWHFDVFLDGDRIGYHHFTLVSTDTARTLTSEARFTVRLFSIPVYRYSHDAVELWDGPCLEHIEAATDDNGEAHRVEGHVSGANFVVNGTSGRADLPGCVMSFAYWDTRILQAGRLLNAQNGDYMDVRVSDLGGDRLQLADTVVDARRYRLQGDDLLIDLWYSKDNQWLALQSTTPSGDILYYARQNIHAL
jgi:hypothetical protein